MTVARRQTQLQDALAAAADGPLLPAATQLFGALGYRSTRRIALADTSGATFAAAFDRDGRLEQRAMLALWRSVEMIFQLGGDDIRAAATAQQSLFIGDQFDQQLYRSFLFFAIELRAKPDDNAYTRTELATITREINRLFSMPTSVLFRFAHISAPDAAPEPRLTLAIVTHRPNRRDDSRDVLEKVSLIHAIRPANPHRAHVEILADLALDHLSSAFPIAGFDDLQRAWARTLDITELNRRFYKEVADWYFWAVANVTFPNGAGARNDVRNATSVIRMLTRLIFVWFLKEKGLVPEKLFRQPDVAVLLASLEPDESSYYKAILQNLFFGTLNTPMSDPKQPRQFRAASRGSWPNAHHGIASVFRYEALFQDAGAALDLFGDVPFLNGGLFECLDPDAGRSAETLVDGFSELAANPLDVPNKLFFGGPDAPVDLNRVYGTRGRSFRVRGLLDILDSYKFTIAENTPVEQEVALDPELLGQVFENLLAAYNPETETTARKETGSFYTPRGVVEYMVDESLLLLFKEQLSAASRLNSGINADPVRLDARLRELLTYTAVPAADLFSETEIAHLISIIDHLKMIDPACGSGAFPMGALQKLVYVLGKLDPGNVRWKQRQEERAERIPDPEARNAALDAIEAAFERNELDYGRKLYLIENCIYGVDIQPVAVQIAKLRCFIALIVEQRVDRADPDNYGIRALPNLETRFVAADALNGVRQVGTRAAQLSMRDPAIDRVERELDAVRSRYFSARTPATKRKYREQDNALRAQLAELLRHDGWDDAAAGMLAAWNPYSQNEKADFFDPEWMFGLRNGFDLVIANPPYVRQEQIKQLKPNFERQYSSYTGTADLYVYFYERAFQLLRAGGVLTFISSNKYFRAGYGKKLRQLLSSEMTIEQVIDFGDAPVFTAIAYPSIIVASKGSPSEQQEMLAVNWNPAARVGDFPQVMAAARQAAAEHAPAAPLVLQTALTADGWRLEGAATQRLLEKLRRAGRPLGDYVQGRFYRGILTGFNEAFVVDRATRDRLVAEDAASAELLKPFLRGRDVKRWRVQPQDLWLIFTRRGVNIKSYPAIEEHLAQYKNQLMPGVSGGRKPGSYQWYEIQDNVAYWQEFEQPKVFIPAITNEPNYAFDEQEFYGNDKTSICVSPQAKMITALLNSAALWWYLRQIAATRQGGFYELKPMYVAQLPIPASSNTGAIEGLVAQILAAKSLTPGPSPTGRGEQSEADVRGWEQEIDERVYALYGLRPDEIRMIEDVRGGRAG